MNLHILRFSFVIGCGVMWCGVVFLAGLINSSLLLVLFANVYTSLKPVLEFSLLPSIL